VTMVTRADLLALLEAAPARSSLRARCDAAARRTVWATGPIHDLSPLAAERGGRAVGEELAGEPEDAAPVASNSTRTVGWL
jgi:hypothetical protein